MNSIFRICTLKRLLVFAMLFFLLTFAAGCLRQRSKPDFGRKDHILLRLAELQSSEYPSCVGDREFARLVGERTGGRIEIRVYDNEQLGNELNVIEQVQFGGIDFARISLSLMAEYCKEMNIFTLPYLYRDSEHMWSILNSDIVNLFLERMQRERFISLCWYEAGARCIYNSSKNIESIEDLKGLKIRVQQSQLMMDTVSNLGGSPVPMQFSEVYNALKTGFIDGAENNIITYFISRHYEVAPYLVVNEHSRIPEIIVASMTTMNQISKEDQEIIKTAAKDSAKLQAKLWSEKEKEVIAELKKQGVKFSMLDNESLNRFREAVTPLYDFYLSDYGEIIEDITKVD